ncbi:MAG: prephenate dehydrogenase/arogenate dehydrogenase family protein [Planctomycetota bacterium]|nr:prephenate dehydrogenase/arogenate dehydrogenase family protein [Planctomycetota bacterium]MCX8039220.1 prephenate dehydrogenase/arogenate dehydrogenase family protein [Planctomycetota bacterium]MDW8372671.1 prephenate dehydrogenase/arogenate dehydrogenase family protein [Planctomycetota bacterium]
MPQGALLVVGLGLMGGSLAAAASAAGWRVLLHHRRPEPMQEARQRGWGEPCPDLGAAEADIAVICTPVEHIVAQARALGPGVRAITDVGSVKGELCRALRDEPRFVGSHPMCGSHRQGLQHADPDLYRGALCIVTPDGREEAQVQAVETLWRSLGCRLLRLSPEEHDRAVAAVSHFPHVVAHLAAQRLDPRNAALAAGGFRDVTRIAGASPELWVGIFLANREAVLAELAVAAGSLEALRQALAAGDPEAVRCWLAAGHAGRCCYEASRG